MRPFLISHRLFWTLSILVCGVLVYSAYSAPSGISIKHIRIGDALFSVEIADTPILLERGLSGRAALSEHQGMLFVFEEPTVPRFWMKDMLFPIDIVWIGDDGFVVGVVERFEPSSYPKTVSPITPVRYVLEVGAGVASSSHIGVGSRAILPKLD